MTQARTAPPDVTGALPPGFNRLLVSSIASNLGDGVRLTAFPLLAATITRDPLGVGAIAAATTAPWLLGPIGGALVDRVDRRRLLVAGQVARALALGLLGLAATSGVATLVQLYVVAVLVGLGEVLVDSATQAAVPTLVGPDQLERANGRLVAAETVTGDILGAPLGGILFALGASLPFAFDAATFLFSALVLATIRFPSPRDGDAGLAPPGGFWADVRVGLTHLWNDRLLRPLAVVLALVNVALTAAFSILVLFALEDLGLDETGYGVLVGIGALGGLVGSFSADRARRALGRGPALVLSSVVVTLGTAVLALAPSAPVATAGLVLLMGAGGLFNVVGQSLRMAVIPAPLLGRVVASFRMVGLGGVPVGAFLGGLVARLTDVRTTIGLAAVLLGITLVAMVVVVRRIPDHAR